MKRTANYCRKIGLLLSAVTAFALLPSSITEAKGLAADNAFDNASFEQIMEIPATGNGGGAICATDHYIIYIENTSETSDADTISAYYKNAVDENGNAVTQYSLAKQVSDYDYERPSGLAYNSKTNELVVAASSADGDTNEGSVFIVDAGTLEYKKTVNVSQYNIIGAAYKEDTDQYIVQTDSEGEYNYKLLDASFNIVEELGQMNSLSEGTGYHGLYISNGYFMNFPITVSTGKGDYLHMYSIAEKEQISSAAIKLPASADISSEEPIAVFESSPGIFAVASYVTKSTGDKVIQLSGTSSVPYEFEITTSAQNGTVSDGSDAVSRGEDFTVSLTPQDGYSLTSLLVDGQPADIKSDASEYVIKDVQSDHKVEAVFDKAGAVKKTEPSQTGKTTPAKSMKINYKLILLIAAGIIIILAVILYLSRVHRLRAEKSRQRKNEIYFQQREYLNDLDVDLPLPDDYTASDEDIEIIEQMYAPEDEPEEELIEEPDGENSEDELSNGDAADETDSSADSKKNS